MGEKQFTKDPSSNRAYTSDLVNNDDDLANIKYYHENSYSSSDFVNKIRWESKEHPIFNNLYRYVCGLIKLRRSASAFRFSTSENIKKGVKFFLEDDFNAYRVISYTLDNKIEFNYGYNIEKVSYSKFIVVHNASFEQLELTNDIFSKDMVILVDSEYAGITPLNHSKVKILDNKLIITPSTTVVLGVVL